MDEFSRLKIAEERGNALEDRSEEIMQSDWQRGKRWGEKRWFGVTSMY